MDEISQTNDTISPSPISHPDSACVLRSSRDEKPLHYTLKIESFSLLKDVLASSNSDRYESQIFNAVGLKWKLALYPNGDEKRNGSDHISLYLVMAAAEDDSLSIATSEVNVMLTFLVYDSLRDKFLTVQDGKVRRFQYAIKKEWGFEKFVELETFNDVSNGLLVDDCCAFGVDIFVMKCIDGKGEVLSLIKQPKSYNFTLKFTNFSLLYSKFYDSNLFTVENYRWKIRLHPRGVSIGKTEYLSLFLILDNFNELPQGFKVYVECEVAVLSKLGSKRQGKIIPYKCWFDSKAHSMDCLDFMSLRDLDYPEKRFLHNETVIVEVKINVISTLKTFV